MKNLAGPVVVVGADGLVGRVVSAKLASVLPKRVVVGGRNRRRINALADSLGSGVVALHLEPDVDIVARVSNCAVVVMCAEMPDAAVARGCVAAGIHYVDVTASAPVIESIARLQPIARASGASALVSVGLAPGLTNVLAAAAVRAAPGVTRLDICVGLGIGAWPWALDQLEHPFEIVDGRVVRQAPVVRDRMEFRLPASHRPLRACRFPFGADPMLASRLGTPTLSTWLCLDSHMATGALALAVRIGAARSLLRNAIIPIIQHLRLGSDAWQVFVQVTTASGVRTVVARGRGEATATGTIAAAAVLHLLGRNPVPGVYHLDEALPLLRLAPLLERLGGDFVFEAGT